MKKFFLEATEDSPLVMLDPDEGKMLIKGRSFMEDAAPFQNIIIDWFRNYIKTPQPVNVLEIEIEYVNSASHHMLLCILEEVNKYFIMGHNFKVIWKYHKGDEYLEDLRREFEELFDLPIKESILV